MMLIVARGTVARAGVWRRTFAQAEVVVVTDDAKALLPSRSTLLLLRCNC